MSTDPKPIPKSARFVLGGAAGITATFICHPIDVVKNRMQMSAIGQRKKEFKSSFHAVRGIVGNEGLAALYYGVSAGVFRQATYSTTRLGVYQFLVESFQNADGTISFPLRTFCGMTAGIAGAFVGTPADVVLIRMTSDGRLPPEKRRNYRNVVDALVRISKEEGFLALWTGVVPTIGRAMVVNATLLATYSEFKSKLLETKLVNDNIFCHLWASLGAGFIACITSLPVDIAKTRIQNMRVIDGKPEYKNMVDAMMQTVKKEGFFALWKGFTPYFAKAAHSILMLIFMEQFTKAYRRYWLRDTSGKGSGF
ncbi:mitochondrial 2-oxoglutarate/malate carrier protein-like [Anabrus simplex]|uniref:mitochondrial 2-oxoglutarate/malate carrier protein-like n=1 Tax=Anabrus simplex TaxID=316456 RepID=UPI0035A32827